MSLKVSAWTRHPFSRARGKRAATRATTRRLWRRLAPAMALGKPRTSSWRTGFRASSSR